MQSHRQNDFVFVDNREKIDNIFQSLGSSMQFIAYIANECIKSDGILNSCKTFFVLKT